MPNINLKRIFMKSLIPVVLIATTLSFFACKTSQKLKDAHVFIQKTEHANRSWKLVWSDEFNQAVLDTTKWSIVPAGGSAWNRHASNDPDCIGFKDGKILLRGLVNTDTSNDKRPYLTGGIYSKGKFAFQYGKIEIHAKLESAQGAWPAMWMLAEKDKYGPYPHNGEMDIMEHLNDDTIIYQTTHSYYTLNLKQENNPPHYGTAALDINAFNTFGLEWNANELLFSVNGKNTFRYPRVPNVDPSQWPYDQPFYVLIDQQLGGDWVGKINPDQLPVQMIVDWVRVYQ